MRISQKVKCDNAKPSAYYFYVETKILVDFISALVYLSPFKRKPHKMVTVADKLFESV